MKVIDLLNKIAKGEITELHKFKWNERVWEEYSKFEEINNDKSYQEHRKNGTSFMRFENICDARHFNDEVEIIEEDTFEDIEEINLGILNEQKEKNRAFKDTINQLIRNQKKIISKLDKE